VTHDDLRDLVPLLALDSLPESEEAQVMAHLETCRECSELLAGHREAAAALALVPPPVMPSDLLRERILREAAAVEEPVLQPAPAKLPVRGSQRRAFRLVASLAAAAVIVAGAVAGMQLGRQNAELRDQRRLLAEQRRALDLAAAGNAVILPISFAVDYSRAEGNVILREESGEAAVLLTGLEDPGSRVYTLWLTPESGDVKNLADFTPANGLAVINVQVTVAQSDGLAVTLERRPGNSSPAGPVVGSAARTPEEESVSA
jgi:hypothetical protein